MTDIPTYKFALRADLGDCPQFLPTRGEPAASGWDVRAAPMDRRPILVKPGQYVKVPLGFRTFCPEGWWFELHPRSSSFAKKSMHALIGLIDQNYPNELIYVAQYLPDLASLGHELVINFGDAVGQIVPVKRQEMNVESISNAEFESLISNRNAVRTGGFGSTTK